MKRALIILGLFASVLPASAQTGTVMRPDTLRKFAKEAGFTGEVETYELGHPFFRLYRLVP